ncbi:MAG: sigma-70 family RNA polymerase sigma factor [Anaerolineales bacterium]|nr:MAG: sigma-70 family RNA polymerase sigma factor [Anaerolineales bacterium]
MQQKEAIWLEGARRLEEDVLGEIYDALSPELYRYGYRLLGDVEQAEDVLSETFVRFLRAIRAGGGPKTHLRAYLYRTLHNLVIDRHRRQEPAWHELVPEEIAAGESTNPAYSVQQQLDGRKARALLWHLTPEQRQVILLKFFQELSNAEIAAALEKTEGAVKALQHRGLASLRRLIVKESVDQEHVG